MEKRVEKRVGDNKKAEGSSQKAIPSAVCDCIDLEDSNMMKDVIMTGTSEEDAVFAKYAEDEMEPCLAMVKKVNHLTIILIKKRRIVLQWKNIKKIEKELMEKMRSEDMMEQGLDAIEVE